MTQTPLPNSKGIGFLFQLHGRVTRRQYALVGFGLMGFKYLSELTFVYLFLQKIWSPLLFLSPLASQKLSILGNQSSWIFWVIVLWSLPFLWIGLVMTSRRAIDAGFSPWLSMFFFFPFANLIFMLVMCVVPSHKGETSSRTPEPSQPERNFQSVLLGLGGGFLICLGMMLLTVFILKEYSATLFFGTPLFAAFFASYFANRDKPKGVRASIGIGALSVTLAGAALILFSLEGLLCLIMAAPIALAASIPGSLLGRAIAQNQHARIHHVAFVLMCLPLMAAGEPPTSQIALHEVQTSIVIDAPPQKVWHNVVSFSDLPKPHRMIFHLGIAYPKRARIVGTGVGAVRHCEFSTGAFVEPITRWDEPRRLSFDVTKNPPTMHEWSPYRKVHAPHLISTFFSKKGEFRLKALPGGKTKLEGSTWYVLQMNPSSYWQLWADALIHNIHKRVLEHIKQLSETHKTSQP